MLTRVKKKHALLFGLVWLAFSKLSAGFAPSNVSFYWGDAELIAIGSVGKGFDEIHGKTARYHLTITEVIRGPELESLENIEILNPAYANSNSRWNAGRPGTQAIFFGKWKSEGEIWVVPRAEKLNDSLLEALRTMQYVDSSRNETERQERLDESLKKHDVQTFSYLLSEARRLGRDDLVVEHFQRTLRKNPTNLVAADELLRGGDLSPLSQLQEFLDNTDFQIDYHLSARGEIAQILSKRLKTGATVILRPYKDDGDEFVALAVAKHEMKVENDLNQWKRIYHLAKSTKDRTIRHNACYSLVSVAAEIPLEELKDIRNFVNENEVSVAISGNLNRAIERREAELDSSG